MASGTLQPYHIDKLKFAAHVEIYVVGDDDHSDNMEAQFKIGFDTIGGLLHWQPVHEEIVITAFIRSNLHFPKGTTYQDEAEEGNQRARANDNASNNVDCCSCGGD